MTKSYEPLIRINARIDRVAEEQLRYVTEHTRMNVTEALKHSIALMYEKVSREQEAPAQIAQRLGFVGMAASGRSDASENYKRAIVRSIASKIKPRADR